MLRIRVLGSLGAEVEGEPVHLGTPRQRALLSLLTTARGGVVPVDRMADALWRGQPPAKALVSLHAYVSNLRRLLEPGRPPRTPATILVTTPPGYALRLSRDAVDAWRFEAAVSRARRAPAEEARALLAEALGWWQGPAFAEHADESWAASEAAGLTGLRTEAAELAVAADLRTGRAAEAVPAAEVLVAQGPLREEGWRLLTLAHWACGRQSDALATLRRATRTLREELGCVPGPALAQLEQAVLTQRLEVLHAAIPMRSASAVPAPKSRVPTSASDAQAVPAVVVPAPATGGKVLNRNTLFVGRTAELGALRAAAGAARNGAGTVLVTGEAGAGKSALLERLAEVLRADGWTVVLGRCPEYEGAPPAWAWVEALGALARDIPPAQPGELAVLLREPENLAATTRDEATAGRFRMHRAFAEWLRAAAGTAPLAVVLEDLHRADGETLALLEAAAALTGMPLLTVASYRPAEVGEHLGKTLAHLAPGAPHRITLCGLPPEDVATVVDAVCGKPVDAPTVAALAERTGGNPFYVLESARLLASEGALVATSEVPQGVRDVLRRRLALLPAGAQAAVQLTAVVGLEAELALLIDAADADEDEVVAGLDAALAADLLTEPGPGRVRFVHTLVRDTMYTDLSGVRRARLHGRVARALRRHHPDDLAALAHHFARSGSPSDAPLAVDYALRAAEVAERRYAHDIAVGLIQQAIDVHTASTPDLYGQPEDTVGLLVRLLGAQIRAGSTEAARGTRQRAVELAEQAGRGDLVAAVYGAWTEPAPWRSRLEGIYDRDSLARLEELAADPRLDEPTRARVLQVLVDAVAAEDAPRALDAARTQLALARTGGEPRLLAAALMTSARLLPHEAQSSARPPLVAELRELARAHDLPAYRWICEHLDGMTAAALNDPEAVRRHTADGLALARRYRMLWAQSLGAAASAMLAAVAGRFDTAEAGYAEADGLLQRVGAHHATALRTLGLITVRLAQGRVAEVEEIIRPVYDSTGPSVGVMLAFALADLGRIDEARTVDFPPEPVTDHLYGLELDIRSRLAVLQDDHATAAALVERLLPLREQLAGAAGMAYATRPLAHALGDLYRFLDEDQAAAEHYALAARTARAWGSPHLTADAHRAAADLSAYRARRRIIVT
ncbi:AAA family ATPase [Streptomyces sp. S3(2020)]|uniref:BTAD domain-containing putative transcriptional regulator n=1 Tax=Streptomyces sp. S3(2020) TaxID=2732044 RepID=UPI001489F6C9|nr:BTAD domain-containing putative transcriptional regulator [Streptomyces sp. S3(2020)]NNN36299.1 AAA family ATPase [Streptomyces sp. S3(2020)]